MKEQIIEIIETKIQELRKEASEELISNNVRNATICISQVNVLREIKHKIYNEIKF